MRTRRARVAGLGLAVLGGAVGALLWSASPPPPLVRAAGPAGELLIQDVRVVDVVDGSATTHRDVWIDAGRIRSVEPHHPAHTATVVLDGRGASLVPGLIDAHCHVLASPAPPGGMALPDPPRNLQRLLYSGVTRVFDPGSAPEEIAELRDAVASGALLGPTIHAAGPLFTAPGGHPAPMVRELAPPGIAGLLISAMTRQPATAEEAREQVAALQPHGFGFVKLVVDQLPPSAPRISADIARAVIDAARDHGLRPVAHVGTTADALDAAAWGAAAWLHGVYKERIRDAAVPELAAAGIPMVPTMVVFRTYGELGRGDFPATELERAVMPPDQLAPRSDPALAAEAPDELRAFTELLYEQRGHALDNVGRLHAAGVTILAGSDAQGGVVHGPSLHRELALLERAGLSPLEVLRSATVHSARFLADTETPDFGVVAPGAQADLLLVEGDPLAEVAALGRIRSVVVQGRVVERVGE
jgi:imidazolonepropionase-like amidohydrolase